MNCNLKHDYVFALAVLHHVARKHDFKDILKKLGDLTKIAAVIEINEMPGWPIEAMLIEINKHFKESKVIGNSLLPCSKKIDKGRWIIHCIK